MTAEPDQDVGRLTDTREETVELANEKRGSVDETSRGEVPGEGSTTKDQGLVAPNPNEEGESNQWVRLHEKGVITKGAKPGNTQFRSRGVPPEARSLVTPNSVEEGLLPEDTEAGNDQDERGRVESVDETPTSQDHRENKSDDTKTRVRQRNSVVRGTKA